MVDDSGMHLDGHGEGGGGALGEFDRRGGGEGGAYKPIGSEDTRR